jgi:hypothetical protein
MPELDENQCCGSALALMQIRIQVFSSMWIRLQIRILVRLCRLKRLNFYMKYLICEGNRS